MGEISRGGFRLEWHIGDHPPRHVHVYDSKDRFIGRLNIESMQGIEDWIPGKKLVKIIRDLIKEGKL